MSRRLVLVGLGSGLASVPLLWWLDAPARIRRTFGRTSAAASASEPPCCAWVDRDGWMLTPDDAAALAERQAAQPPVERGEP